MLLDRRTITTLAAASVTAATVLSGRSRAAGRPPFRAVAFDGFPVIDPRPVSVRLEEMFPGMGAELSAVWRTRQFEYSWLRTLGGQYADFWRVTEDALLFAAKAMKISLAPEQRDRAMQSYLELKAWPDVAPALVQLRAAGLRLAFLSNFTAPMLDAVIKNSGLEGLFEEHLSTDKVAAFKPDARAYQMGVDAFGLKKEEIVFAAFAGWDVAGAKWFGYPTFWVNRTNASAEELGVTPDGAGPGLHDLVAFATAR